MKRRTRRILLWLTAVLALAAFGGSALALWLYNNPNRLLPLVISRFEARTGLLLTADTFFVDKPGLHRFRLTGRMVGVTDKKSMSKVFSSENFTAVCDLSGLFTGVVVVETVRVSGLSASVSVTDGGRMSLGGWVMPKKSAGGPQKPDIKISVLDVDEGAISLGLPPGWGLGTVEVTRLSAHATPDKGGGKFLASGLVSRAGKTGKIAVGGQEKADAWHFHVNCENLPADGFTIPKAGRGVPAMPVFASLNLDGNFALTEKGVVTGKATVKIKDAYVKNHKVPGGRITVDDLSGVASLAHDPDSGTGALFAVNRLTLPFSTFKGFASFSKGRKRPARFSMKLKSQDFLWDDFKPWLGGFLLPDTDRFLKANITRALCRNVSLDLSWDQKPAKGRDPVNLLVTANAENLSMTFDNPMITAATDVRANVSLNVHGLAAELMSAAGKGCTVTGGKVDIIWDLPKTTPLSFTLKGRVDTSEAWPWMRAAIGGDGFVSRLGLSGPTEAEVSWKWEDISTEGTDTFDIIAEAGGISARLDSPKRPLDFSKVSGKVSVNPEAVVFKNLTAFYGPVSAKLDGSVAITENGAFSLKAELGRLETLLPAFAGKRHPLYGWRPKALSGLCVVERKHNENSASDITAQLSTLDEAGRVFSAQALFSPRSWEISSMKGAMGGFKISGSAGVETGAINLSSVIPGLKMPYTFNLAWKGGRARADVSGPEMLLDDFISPLLPGALGGILAWTAAQPGSKKAIRQPFEKVDFSVDTPRFRLTRDLTGPARATGAISLNSTDRVVINRINFSGRTAALVYRDYPEKNALSVNLASENLKDLAAIVSQALSPPETRASTGQSKPLEVAVKVANLVIPGRKAEPLSALVTVSGSNGRFKARGVIRLGNRNIKASFEETPAGLIGSIFADRMEASLAATTINALGGLSGSSTATASPDSLTRAELAVSIADLVFPDNLRSSLSASFGLWLSRQKGATRTEINFKKLALFGQESRGLLSLGPDVNRVNAFFPRLDPAGIKTAVRAVSALFPDGQENNRNPPFDFTLSAPQAMVPGKGAMPFFMSGRLKTLPDGLDLNLEKLGLGSQQGEAHLVSEKGRWKADAFFSFLELETLKALSSYTSGKAAARSGADQKGESKKISPEKSKGTRIAFPLSIPAIYLEADIKADRLDLGKRGVLSSVSVRGSTSPQKVIISHVTWKKDGEEAFRLGGALVKKSEKLWQGDVSADFSDMGHAAAVFFPPKSPKDEKFPVDGGVTHLSARADINPAPDGLWTPKGRIAFASREGRIKRGGPLVFVMGALSPFNYARALAGKKSELSGGVVFNLMEGEADFNGGSVSLTKFSFQSPSLRYVATGDFNVETNRQNLNVCVQPFGTVNKILSLTPGLNLILQNKDGAFIQSCFTVEGDMDDPKVTAIPQSMIPTRLGDLFNR